MRSIFLLASEFTKLCVHCEFTSRRSGCQGRALMERGAASFIQSSRHLVLPLVLMVLHLRRRTRKDGHVLPARTATLTKDLEILFSLELRSAARREP